MEEQDWEREIREYGPHRICTPPPGFRDVIGQPCRSCRARSTSGRIKQNPSILPHIHQKKFAVEFREHTCASKIETNIEPRIQIQEVGRKWDLDQKKKQKSGEGLAAAMYGAAVQPWMGQRDAGDGEDDERQFARVGLGTLG